MATQTRRRMSPLAHRPYLQYERCPIGLTPLVWIAPAGARIYRSHVHVLARGFLRRAGEQPLHAGGNA
ncbi:MAG: hypothetical protein ABR521_08885 [Gaiellaceae bacterium]